MATNQPVLDSWVKAGAFWPHKIEETALRVTKTQKTQPEVELLSICVQREGNFYFKNDDLFTSLINVEKKVGRIYFILTPLLCDTPKNMQNLSNFDNWSLMKI